LRKVGDRLSGVARRLGYLEARIYYKQRGYNPLAIVSNSFYPWLELPVWKFIDNGFGRQAASDQDFISQQQERAFTAQVNKDWWDEYRLSLYDFDYAAKFRPKDVSDRFIGLSLDDVSAKDEDTFTTLKFKEVNIV